MMIKSHLNLLSNRLFVLHAAVAVNSEGIATVFGSDISF